MRRSVTVHPLQFVNYKHGRYALKSCPVCGNKTYRTHCSNKCFAVTQLRLLFEKIDRGEYVAKPIGGNTTLKKYLIDRRGRQCEKCKNVEWLGNKIPLTTHHIDGNANNNHPDNLQLLCWNCHALTDNYGKKNKNSARVDRYSFAPLA